MRTICAVLGLLAIGAGPTLPPKPPAAAAPSQIIVLGDGTPAISADRSGTSVGIAVRGTLYVFDAGPGVIRRIFEAEDEQGASWRIGPVFITHLHSDHTLGLPALLYYHAPGSLRVIGPPGISQMMDGIEAAWSADRRIRSGEGGSPRAGARDDSTNMLASVREVTTGTVFKDSNIVVQAFEVQHGQWPHALGYRIEAPDRVIVISGDTRPSDAVVNACRGCDVLMHEVYAVPRQPSSSDDYFRRYHTSASELGELAARAKPKLLVMYHQVFRGRTRVDLLRQVSLAFHGPVISARDLDEY